MKWVFGLALAFLWSVNLAAEDIEVTKGISNALLQRQGIKPQQCPRFIAHRRSGLATSILPRTTACLNSGKLGKFARRVSPGEFVLNGKYRVGRAFPEVVEQEGDVQTLPFEVSNYPAIIEFTVDGPESFQFTVAVVDAVTGREAYKAVNFRSIEEGLHMGEFAFNHPGRYYFRIQAQGKDLQPVFGASMYFMDTYEGYRVSARDIRQARLKSVACPTHLLDRETLRFYPVGRGYFCTNGNGTRVEDAGFTLAPLNLGITMFMATDVYASYENNHTWLPFRIMRPTPFLYSVDDPSERGTGSTRFFLHSLTTGRSVANLVNVKGSIMGTETSINIPGDYYVYAALNHTNPKENGNIYFDYEVFPDP